jgi:hypothetical protein
VVRLYDNAGNVIETHEYKGGDFKEPYWLVTSGFRWRPFPFRSSRRLVFHPRRIVSTNVTESALGKNLTCFDRYMMSRMCLAVIATG